MQVHNLTKWGIVLTWALTCKTDVFFFILRMTFEDLVWLGGGGGTFALFCRILPPLGIYKQFSIVVPQKVFSTQFLSPLTKFLNEALQRELDINIVLFRDSLKLSPHWPFVEKWPKHCYMYYRLHNWTYDTINSPYQERIDRMERRKPLIHLHLIWYCDEQALELWLPGNTVTVPAL